MQCGEDIKLLHVIMTYHSDRHRQSDIYAHQCMHMHALIKMLCVWYNWQNRDAMMTYFLSGAHPYTS